jgi:hypothetical protein
MFDSVKLYKILGLYRDFGGHFYSVDLKGSVMQHLNYDMLVQYVAGKMMDEKISKKVKKTYHE